MRSTTRTAHPRTMARATHRAAVSRRDRRTRSVALVVDVPVCAVEVRQTERSGSAHLTRRGRLVVLLALVGLLFAAFSLGRAGTEAATAAESSPPLVETTVQPGESLWTVARRISPTSDPREVVQDLRRINHLPGSGLQAGQQLLLPA